MSEHSGFTALTAITLRAGTATAGTAPLYFVSGISLTSPAIGALEFDGTNLYFTPSATRETVVITNSTPTLAGLNLGTGNLSTVGNISIDGSAARNATVARSATGTGSALTVQSGGALSGANNTAAGNLILATGIGTGSSSGASIHLQTSAQGTSGTGDESLTTRMYVAGTTNTRVLIGNGLNTTTDTNDGITLLGSLAQAVYMRRHTTSNTAGNNLTLTSGGATSGATDKASGDLILKTGLSTGVGRSKVRIQTNDIQPNVTTGTTDTTATDRIIVVSPKILTNNTTTTVLSCTLANDSVLALIIEYSAEVLDGSHNVQVEEGIVSVHVTNTNGTIANNTTVKANNQQAMTSGTLAVTWTVTAANPALVQLNINSSLTPATGYPRFTMIVKNLTQQAITIS